MNVNFDATINDLAGNAVVENGKPVTLGSLCSIALLGSYEDERQLSGDKKVLRFKLAQQVYDGGFVDLKAEDIAELKLVVAKAFTALPCARCYELLDPPAA